MLSLNQMEQQVSDLNRNADSKKPDNKRGKESSSAQEDVEHLRQQLEALQAENRSLKERLLDMGVPIEQTSLSDSEKEQILLRRSASGSMASLDSERREGCQQCGAGTSSAVRADSTEHLAATGGELDEIPGSSNTLEEPPLGRSLVEWDKASSSSLSEMSVACLQDRIMQMEETHYSTSEELQATLQELSDLQDQLTDLQLDNERMGEEKTVLLESLCSQTEKLEDCRSQIQHLKHLLLQNFEEGFKSDISLTATERELHYVQLLKNAQEEQENLLQKHEEMSATLQASKEQSLANVNEFLLLKERVRFLESTVESVHADRRLLDEQLAESQEQTGTTQIEVGQLRLQLENEQQKVKDMQREREAGAASELESLLQESRMDKEKTDEKLLHMQEQLTLSQREVTKLKEQLSQLQEETMVSKNNAHKQLSDLQFLVSQLESGKLSLQKEGELLSEALRQTETKCQRHLEDKRELIANVTEMQKALAERQARIKELTRDLDQSRDKLSKDTEEWLKFQSDLLTSVRVANDLRMEAQQDLEKLTAENKNLKEKVDSLQAEISRLKDRQQELMTTAVSPMNHSLPTLHRGSPLRALTPEAGDRHCDLPSAAAAAVVASASTAARRQMGSGKLGATQLSVRSLIESIENATKQAKEIGLGSSRSSSTSSLSSITSESRKWGNSLF